MSIVLAGDTHGSMDIRKLGNDKVLKACGGEYPSHVIILGDFGLVWTKDTPEELYWLKWLEEKPWITLVTLGNHENYERIYQLPLVDLYGGKAYKLSDKIFILQHGHVFTVEGKTFFNFGGARSIDKAYRQNRITWWEEEEPTQADFFRGKENLAKVNNTVDYVITHTAPQEAIDAIRHNLPFSDSSYFDLKSKDSTVTMLNEYLQLGLTFKAWLFGHFHIDESFIKNNRAYSVAYDTLKVIE